jgi:formylglycine-generating enzyme required for sulfatase activity
MHGNVWEWCWDWHAPLPVGDVVDPVGRFAGSLRVYRGGSWSNRAANCRAARRSWLDPANRTDDLGFRLALSFVGVSAESGKDKKD